MQNWSRVKRLERLFYKALLDPGLVFLINIEMQWIQKNEVLIKTIEKVLHELR